MPSETARQMSVVERKVCSGRPKVIDLFAGAGGLSLGAARAGFEVVAAFEKDLFAYATHRRNFPKTVHVADEINDGLTGEALLSHVGLKPGELDGLIGGPPCQGFSVIGKKELDDERNNLFVQFFRLVAETRPAFYLAENVPNILSERFTSVLAAAKACLGNDYVQLEPFVVKASEYGAPTSRKRVIFVGYRQGAFPSLSTEDFKPSDVEPVNVKQALQGLPQINPDWLMEEDGWRPIKRSYGVPKKFLRRLHGEIPEGLGNPEAIMRLQNERFVSGCMGTRHSKVVTERYSKLKPGQQDKTSKSIRLKADGFCPTLRAGTDNTKGSYQAVRPIHYKTPRVITPREAARLQGFPDWFVFDTTKWHSFRQIGNSVSPIVAEHLMRVFFRLRSSNDYL